MNGYLQPMNALGFGTFTQAGQPAGWYQFNTVHKDPALTAIPGISIPPDVQGFMIQAKASLDYIFSPTAAVAGATSSFNIPAGGYAFFPGADALARFCMLMPAAGAQFVVTFYSGSIGPIPMLNIPDTGGVIPPPPPGLSAIYTPNTIWVMKTDGIYGGNDATGTRNRMDLPFLTPEAAEAVAVPGDSIVILAGDYTLTAPLGKQLVTYIRWGANLSTGVGIGPVFLANGITFRVTGTGNITCFDPAGYAVRSTDSGDLTVDGDIASSGGGVKCDLDGILFIRGDVLASVGHGAYCEAGYQRITGTCRSVSGTAAYANSASAVQEIGGSAISQDSTGARCTSGTQTITGDATSNDAVGSSFGASCTGGGTQTIGGNATSIAYIGAECADGTQTIGGNATSTDSYGAHTTSSNSVQWVKGNAVSVNSYGAVLDAGVQTIGGNAEAGGANAAYCGAGVQVIKGNAIITAVGTGVAAATNLSTSDQTIFGDVINLGTGTGAKSDAGSCVIYGNAFADNGYALFVQGGSIELKGRATTAHSTSACHMDGGTLILGEGAGSVSQALPAVTIDSAALVVLRGNCVLDNDGTGVIIEDTLSAGSTVRSYGAYGRAALDGGLTLEGDFTVLP